MPTPLVSIIILAWRNEQLLLACLRALHEDCRRTVPFEIIVVLNGCSQALEDTLRKACNYVCFVRSAVNRGFAGGCNLGASVAAGEFLVLLNDDAIVERGWLMWLITAAQSHRDAGAIGSCVLFDDGRIQEAGSILWDDGSTMPIARGAPGDSLEWHFVRQVDYASACSLLVRRETWEAVGGMDEGYWPAYYEDVDLCLAIRTLGQRVLYEPRSRVRHLESASSDGQFKTFLFKRNQIRLREKWRATFDTQEPATPWSPAAITRAVWRARGCPRRVLIVDDRVPDRAMGAGLGRMVDAVTDMVGAGYALTFLATGVPARTTDQLIDLGVGVLSGELEAHVARPDVVYEAVIVSRPHNFARVRSLARRFQPQAALIYDCEALFWRRVHRQSQLSTNGEQAEHLRHEAEQLRGIEEDIIVRSDFAVAVSGEEAAILRSVEGHCPVAVLPPTEPNVSLSHQSFWARRGVAFVAGWMAGSNSPNADGLRWFVREVLPMVRADVPWIRIHVTGSNPPADLLQLRDPNVIFEGHVDDLSALYNAVRVVISPIRYGAGVKLKTVEALQHGLPTVSTMVGAEGIDLHGLPALVITDDPGAFARALVLLLSDPVEWDQRRAAVAELVDTWRGVERKWVWPTVIDEALARRSGGRQPLFLSG